MKNIYNTTLLVYIALSASLTALDVQWTTQLPPGTNISHLESGSDGSAVAFDRSTDTLYWISSNGSIAATITEFTGSNPYNLDNITYISSEIIIIPLYSDPTWETKVIEKSESGHSVETLIGVPGSFQVASSAPFFAIATGNEIKQYRIAEPSNQSTVQTIPANAIVIPALYSGQVSISLESSIDLVDWTQVLPGTFSSENNSRFFRVRATPQE